MPVGLLVLSGFNLRAVVALCRWAAAAGSPLHLVARHASDPIYLTLYREQVFAERSSAHLDLAETTGWIKRLRADHGYARVLLAPSTEFFNRFILQHRAALEAAGGIVPLVEERLYARISDKHAFAELCASRGIDVPGSFERPPGHFPFVAKPKTYGAATSGQIKPYLMHTPADLAHFSAREVAANFFFQEFVEGQSLYLLAHVSQRGTVIACAQENLIQQARGGSIILARAHDFHRHPDAAPYLQLLRDVGFHGLIMIEVRRCARTGRHVMIEANPRMWGPMQFTLDQQVDLLGALLADHGLIGVSHPHAEPVRSYYFWSGGMSRAQQPFAFHRYSADRFVEDYPSIAACDLFSRPDTRHLYEHELTEP